METICATIFQNFPPQTNNQHSSAHLEQQHPNFFLVLLGITQLHFSLRNPINPTILKDFYIVPFQVPCTLYKHSHNEQSISVLNLIYFVFTKQSYVVYLLMPDKALKIFFLKYLLIWLHQVLVAACRVFSWSMWDLLVVKCGHLVAARGIQFPIQGSNPGTLHWEDGVSATGPPEKSLKSVF